MPTFDNFKTTFKGMNAKVRSKDNDDTKWVSTEKTKEQQAASASES